MTLTVRSWHWLCTEAEAKSVAEELRLRQVVTTHTDWDAERALKAEWEKSRPMPKEPACTEAEYELPYARYNTLPKIAEYYKALDKWRKAWDVKFAHLKADGKVEKAPDCAHDRYEAWEDYQTGGGGCRITWYRGVAWISAHSGYAWADRTDVAAIMFERIGCQPADRNLESPRMYDVQRSDESFEYVASGYYTREGD